MNLSRVDKQKMEAGRRERPWRARWGMGPGHRGTRSRRRRAIHLICRRKFGQLGWWTFAEVVRKDGQDLCYVCAQPAERWAWMNVWGAVRALRMCDTHARQYDGRACDDLPNAAEAVTAQRRAV